MSLLVFLEHHEHTLSPGSLGVLTKAVALDPDIAAVLVGDGDLARARRARPVATARRPCSPRSTRTRIRCPVPASTSLAEILRQFPKFDSVLLSNSVLAADVAAGLAARLDAGINWDLVDLELRDGEPVGKQPMLQDSVLADVGWRSPQRIALFRAGLVRGGAVGDRRTSRRWNR